MKAFYKFKNSFSLKSVIFFHFFVFFIVCNYFNFFVFFKTNFAHAEITYFARIVQPNTHIYLTCDENSPIFILPQTYFVELLGNSDSKDYYYAKYNDIYGYVKKSEVKAVLNTPQMPYLSNISFRVFVPSGANLRTSPQNSGAVNLICSIPFLETNLLYYGSILGEEAISKKGSTWYYCKYYLNNNQHLGYVYAPLTDCLSRITPNEEPVEFIDGELKFKDESQPTFTTNSMENLSSTAQTIIIVAVSLPCLLFIYLLFKPTQISEKTTKSKRNKRKISRLKHSDYYEYDDF